MLVRSYITLRDTPAFGVARLIDLVISFSNEGISFDGYICEVFSI